MTKIFKYQFLQARCYNIFVFAERLPFYNMLSLTLKLSSRLWTQGGAPPFGRHLHSSI
ncbi:hypothetical protein ACMA1I_23030 [Pontibacter sp. 13R65]|uniref:hypothetical protein n=1 Tax=Pontibacter sp. 13R65 TaxID=3127458 RepID=UPI00301C4F8C